MSIPNNFSSFSSSGPVLVPYVSRFRSPESFSKEVRIFVENWRVSGLTISAEDEDMISELFQCLEGLSDVLSRRDLITLDRGDYARVLSCYSHCLHLYASLKGKFFFLCRDKRSIQEKCVQKDQDLSFEKSFFQDSSSERFSTHSVCPSGANAFLLVVGVFLSVAIFFIIFAPLFFISSLGMFTMMALGLGVAAAVCVSSVAVIYLVTKCCFLGKSV
ncbi:hypothetical protein [Chlamydiifrater volucris]|uniref:hypothetical protein n=1 Tax=Chlamydiifrater volucris TaxID=2681470 RepID=UPI001BD13C41|nr:hypothetical protein [Chlamydiifrater volucris]